MRECARKHCNTPAGHVPELPGSLRLPELADGWVPSLCSLASAVLGRLLPQVAERAAQELREALEVLGIVKPVPLVIKVTFPLALFGASQHGVLVRSANDWGMDQGLGEGI